MKKRVISILGAVFALALILVGVSLLRSADASRGNENKTGSNSNGFVGMYLPGSVRLEEPYRAYYSLGSCRVLTEDVHVVCLFLEDDESQWSIESMQTVANDLMPQALAYIEDWAARFGYEIDLTHEVYSVNDTNALQYDGIIGDMDTNTSLDIMPQAAQALGYDSAAQMHEALVTRSGKAQVAYMLFVNKLGRSYATQDRSNDNLDMVEYTVNFTGTTTGVLPAPNGFVHEFLHLFGAEDMYADGTYHVNRAALADELHYFAIMRRIHSDLEINLISDFTAYTVGWLDEMPPQYNTEQWWS